MAHSRIFSDTKFQRLVKRLDEPMAHVLGHLECLWQYAYEHCLPKGSIDKKDIEDAAHWDGAKGVFMRAVLAESFIERKGRGYFIHQFKSNAPAYVRKRMERKKLRDSTCRDTVATAGRQRLPIEVEPKRTEENRREPPPPTPANAGDEAAGGGGIHASHGKTEEEMKLLEKMLRDRGVQSGKAIAKCLEQHAERVDFHCRQFDLANEHKANYGAGMLIEMIQTNGTWEIPEAAPPENKPPERERWPWKCDACGAVFMLAFKDAAVGANLKCDGCGKGTLKLDAKEGA